MNSRYFFFHEFRFVYAYTFFSSFLNWNSNEKKKISIERIFFQKILFFRKNGAFQKQWLWTFLASTWKQQSTFQSQNNTTPLANTKPRSLRFNRFRVPKISTLLITHIQIVLDYQIVPRQSILVQLCWKAHSQHPKSVVPKMATVHIFPHKR